MSVKVQHAFQIPINLLFSVWISWLWSRMFVHWLEGQCSMLHSDLLFSYVINFIFLPFTALKHTHELLLLYKFYIFLKIIQLFFFPWNFIFYQIFWLTSLLLALNQNYFVSRIIIILCVKLFFIFQKIS